MTSDSRPVRDPAGPPDSLPRSAPRAQWWQAAFNASEDAQVICSPEGRIRDLNRRAAQILEFSIEGDAAQADLAPVLSPQTANRLAEIFKRRAAKPEVLSAVTLLSGGRLRTIIDLHVTPMEGGMWLVVIKDASRRWRMESHVQRLITAIDSTSEVFFLTDADGNLTFVNAAFQNLTGHSIEDVIGRPPDFLRAPNQDDTVAEYLKSVREGLDWTGELVNQRADGTTYPVEAVISPIHDRVGKFIGYVASERDLSANKGLQKEVLTERNFARSILNSMDAAIYTVDRDFNLTHRNEGCQKFPARHGWLTMEKTPAIGDFFLDYVLEPENRRQLTGILLEVLSSGAARDFEVDEGESRCWAVTVSPWCHDKEVIGLIYKVKDQTRLRDLQRQLYEAQKMEIMGSLAAGVAHDFNNLLQVIRGNLTLLMDHFGPFSPVDAQFKQIEQAAERASQITDRLLSFSRTSEGGVEVFDFNHRLRSVGEMASRSSRGNVRIQVETPAEPMFVSMNETRADQLLLNLCVNAQDAMPKGGAVRLSSKKIALDEERARQRGLEPGADFLCCSVTDTGSGIPPEILPKIFNAFFTTKAKGKGTGLGLSIVQTAVAQAGGFIEVKSQPGEGTTFLIYLPIVGPPEPVAAAALPEEKTGGRSSGSILVVEDQDLVRNFTQSFLEKEGFTVIAVASGPEALDQLHDPGLPVDLLLTDYNMPDMNGLEVIERACLCRPALKAVLVSGYLDPEEEARVRAHGSIEILKKPFKSRDAIRLISGVISRPA